MPRFKLIFRENGGRERSEIHDGSEHDEPHIDGKLIVDGETYTINGVEWIIRRENTIDGMPRFTCRLAATRDD